jgi:uncharacterized protein YjbJ (UPF0337 family)
MPENNNPSPSQSQSSAAHSGETRGSVQKRLEKLREKVSDLSETLDRVEQTAAESAGKIKE